MSDPARPATLVLLLGRLERLNESLVAEVCSSRGISPGEFRVLAMLRHGGSDDGVRPTEISRWVVQTTGGLTATLHRLERDGRAERVPDSRDGRSRLVRLTTAGRSFYDDVLDELTDRYETVLAGVDVEATQATVRSLISGFERAGGRSPTGEWDLTRHPTGPRG